MARTVMSVVQAGTCTGCGNCFGCLHIRFEKNALGFHSPVVDGGCVHCGKCLDKCSYNPLSEDDEDE